VDLLWFVLVVMLAAGTRFWYLSECLDGATAEQEPFLVQIPSPHVEHTDFEHLGKEDEQTELDVLVHHIAEDDLFVGMAPLGPDEENTAHIAPGYPWVVALMYRFAGEQEVVPKIRWVQCGLGALTAGLYFVFARLAFGNLLVALLTGLLCAVHPFWIINTGQVADGVLTSLLLAGCLVLGTRAGKAGDAIAGLLFGLTLAGLVLVRAALLPFAVAGLLWFMLRCRSLPRGWFLALLAVLGFLNGAAPWVVRNYQTFGDIVPVADSTWLHVWIGNNPKATGAELDHEIMEQVLGPKRLKELHDEPVQSRRYPMLAVDVGEFVTEYPAKALRNRIAAGLSFFLGQDWFSTVAPGDNIRSTDAAPPAWLVTYYPEIVNGLLLGMLGLALLGWRWSHVWRGHTALATLAVLWITLPYLLSHASTLWGPRLPLDGILLCYSAFALVYLIPGLRGAISDGPQPGVREV
jgi:4-amino-4-deoxy-L-arabinose transferase-like glycosyltransferase